MRYLTGCFAATLIATPLAFPVHASTATCQAAQLKTLGAFCARVLNCESTYARAAQLSTAATRLDACVARAESSFSVAWNRAVARERRRGLECTLASDASTLLSEQSAQTADLAALLSAGFAAEDPRSRRLYGSVLAAAASHCSAGLSAHAANAVKPNLNALSAALSRAESRFAVAHAKQLLRAQRAGLTFLGETLETMARLLEAFVERATDAVQGQASERFRVGGTVTGLSGGELRLKLNSRPELVLSTDGRFEFADRLAAGAAYRVAIVEQPPGLNCLPIEATGFVVGSDVTDLAVVCQSNGGSTTGAPEYAWHTFYGGQPEEGHPETYAALVDHDGNLIVAGIAFGAWPGDQGAAPINAFTGNRNLWVLKLDPTGRYLWHTFLGSVRAITGSYQLGLAVDSANNIFVGSSSSENWRGPLGQSPLVAYHGGNGDGFVLKLSGAGQYLWHRFVGAGGNLGHDGIHDIAVDAAGAVYAIGDSTVQWTEPNRAPLHHSDPVPASLASGGSFAPFVLKLDSEGELQWYTFYGRNDGNSFFGGGIALDGLGNLYVAGRGSSSWAGENGTEPLNAISDGTQRVSDAFLLKLLDTGEYVWHTFFDAQLESIASKVGAKSVRVDTDPDGNVLVASTANGGRLGPNGNAPLVPFHGGHDFAIAKFSGTGDYQWHSYYGSADDDDLTDLAVDDAGNIHVVGYAQSPWLAPNGSEPLTPFNDSALVETASLQLDATGELRWHRFIEAITTALADGPNDLYLAGFGAVHFANEPLRYILGPATPAPLRGVDGLYVLKFRR